MPAIKPTSDGARTAGASWPSNTAVPGEVKKLLDLFLSLLDLNEDTSGIALVDHIFTQDAIFKTSSATFTGAQEIKESRKGAWAIVEKRNHTINKCYTCNNDASDILCIGDAVLNLKNGKEVVGNFISRTVLMGTSTPEPRIKYFEVWGDTAPMMKAMQE